MPTNLHIIPTKKKKTKKHQEVDLNLYRVASTVPKSVPLLPVSLLARGPQGLVSSCSTLCENF